MGQTTERTPDDPRRAEVRARMARAHGHLHGIIDMIDEERPYAEILQQINAVRAALDKATGVILDDMITNAETAPKTKQREHLDQLRTAVRTLS